MKNEQANQALAIIGIALLMVASGGDTLMFDDAIKNAVLKAIGVDTDIDRKEKNEPEGYGPSDYVYGIRGLSDYLGVSPPTAQKYVNSGKLDAAIRKVGRKYSFHKAKVDEIFGNDDWRQLRITTSEYKETEKGKHPSLLRVPEKELGGSITMSIDKCNLIKTFIYEILGFR